MVPYLDTYTYCDRHESQFHPQNLAPGNHFGKQEESGGRGKGGQNEPPGKGGGTNGGVRKRTEVAPVIGHRGSCALQEECVRQLPV